MYPSSARGKVRGMAKADEGGGGMKGYAQGPKLNEPETPPEASH